VCDSPVEETQHIEKGCQRYNDLVELAANHCLFLYSPNELAGGIAAVAVSHPFFVCVVLASAYHSKREWRTHEPWLFLRRSHHPVVRIRWYRCDHFVVVSGGDSLGIVERHFDTVCQGMMLNEADENSEGLFVCVLRPRDRLCRRPGVRKSGEGLTTYRPIAPLRTASELVRPPETGCEESWMKESAVTSPKISNSGHGSF
jgi:hypothetical protein